MLVAEAGRLCRVSRVSASTAVESISLASGIVGLAALGKEAQIPAASLDVDLVTGVLPIAGVLALGTLLAGLSRLLEEGHDSVGVLPVAGMLVAGTLLADLSRLLEEGRDSAATGGCIPAGAELATMAVPANFLGGSLALPPCLSLAPNFAGCFLAGKTGCHCSSSSSDGSACADSA